MKICPKCQHKQTEWEKSLSPHECPQCGFFYNAREHVNAEKRRQNLKLKPWRVTRWRPQYKIGLIFGVPTVMIVLYVVYRGCPEFCVNAFLKFDHSVLELDAESGQRGLPVSDGKSPFSADVLHGQIEQFEQGVVIGECPSIFCDFPQAHVE